ncbi:hypothetical protein PC116_g9754 [Phytophthora cactorum]|uniref:Uncharacterized protein n=1 Tax=Phytophthora cactorum TaxID=29920 RepID=A0A8T1L0X6_9STRA|nr:hypothetical protein Pcac1_g11606 [Phytophthora cactorum]KAG2896948.1 hypothetical protein PC114_g14866 [Phytophthora cactorum]KAG2924147.1 hypothetical protein PC117_g15445 [Phytophthora cactorum]KAG3004538.1 hypothetical protein PC119_g15606 [Phytophthora cactorum]KAG3011042.1 hypothetical protein PC120_g14676 [Phytophthora cactorum]
MALNPRFTSLSWERTPFTFRDLFAPDDVSNIPAFNYLSLQKSLNATSDVACLGARRLDDSSVVVTVASLH